MKGSNVCESTRQTLGEPVEEHLHMHCVNLRVAITIHHPRISVTSV